jgi:Peptidase family M28
MTPPPPNGYRDFRRRRPRRGSLARPINGRLYRASFLVVLLALVVLAFGVARPVPLAKPSLPGSFDTASALALANDLSSQYPDRRPGSAGAIGAWSWFGDQLPPQSYGLAMRASSWYERIPGLGRVQLRNIVAVAPGQSQDVIVVMAHRDDIGTGPGANDNASGTAALIELARAYAQPLNEGATHVVSPRRIVFLSTDGGAYGGLGAAHFLESSPYRNRIVAVVDLDAIAGKARPSIEIAGDSPRSPNASLVATAIARIAEQTGTPPRHVSVLGQLVDLAFPYTLYEQGPFVAAGIPAITITTGGDRPPPAFGDRSVTLDSTRLGQLGAAAQQLVGSLDQSLSLASSPGSYVWVGGRVVRGWAIELVLVALLIPFAVAIVDLYALCRRQGVQLRPAFGSLRTRLLFWFFVGIVFTCFRFLNAWPSGVPRPPNPATATAGDWPAWALVGLVAVTGIGWALSRPRLAKRRPVTPEEEIAGYAVALVALLVVAIGITATNAFALLFALPALHAWLWLPQFRIARPPVRLGLFLLGLAGPAALVVSIGWRYGLGFDTPWYLLELAGIGYIKPIGIVIVLAGTAAAAQLAAAATGRYAPYPAPEERSPRGPVREGVRRSVLAVRARRELQAEVGDGRAGSELPVAPGNEHERVGRRGTRDHVGLLPGERVEHNGPVLDPRARS